MTDQKPPLSPAETRNVLRKLGDLTNQIVLIGGQSLAFWAERYANRIGVTEPVNSFDIDFASGELESVNTCARLLHGTPRFPEPFSPTPNFGVVTFFDSAGIEREIDFVDPFGLDYAEVHEMAIGVEVPEESGVTSFLVMHPVHCLESRTHNVSGLPGYQTKLGFAQLRASVLCAREYLRDRLDEGDAPAVRAVLDLNERIYRFAWGNMHALAVFRDHGIDVFEGVLIDERLPKAFHEERLPRMRAALARKRARRSGNAG